MSKKNDPVVFIRKWFSEANSHAAITLLKVVAADNGLTVSEPRKPATEQKARKKKGEPSTEVPQ